MARQKDQNEIRGEIFFPFVYQLEKGQTVRYKQEVRTVDHVVDLKGIATIHWADGTKTDFPRKNRVETVRE